MKQLRLALLGFGTVGQWLAEVLHRQQAWLQQEFGLAVTLISVATAHHGLMYRNDGLDIPTLLDLVATRQPLTAHPSVTHWTNVLEGLQATGGDVLAEATMRARAEGNVLVRHAREVERVGPRELVGVAIGGGEIHHGLLTLANSLSRDFAILPGAPAHIDHGGTPAQQLRCWWRAARPVQRRTTTATHCPAAETEGRRPLSSCTRRSYRCSATCTTVAPSSPSRSPRTAASRSTSSSR